MSALGLIIAIALPVALLLTGVVFYGRHQQRLQAKRLQASLIRAKADELREALEFLILVDDFRDLQRVVLERVEQLYRLYEDTLPKTPGDAGVDDASTETSGTDTEALRARIDANPEIRTVLKSDREIRLAKQQFSRILKTLGAMTRQKQISDTNLAEYRRYLRLTLLEREVDTYTAQGDVAAERGDVVTAGGYYKAARKLLIEFDMQYPEKNERIRMLAQRTSALYNGGIIKEDMLSRALSREADVAKDPHGIPLDPVEKRKF
jgi:hypothetical protein